MSDNIIDIKDFYNLETRASIIENAIISIDRRFEQVDKQLDRIDKRFEQIERRFEQIDKRFEQIERRFEQVDKKFERLEDKIDSHFKWLLGLIAMPLYTSIIGFIIGKACHWL